MSGGRRKQGATGDPGYIVPALERGLRMLQAFSKDEPVQSLGKLAREMNLPRSTVFRLANTLEHLGYLVHDEEAGEYRIGAAALQLGWNYLAALELPEIAQPFLARLCNRTGASAHLAVRDGRYIVYVCRVAANAALTSNIRVGSRLPAHATSMGRALLSDLDEGELQRLYGDAGELAAFSRETPTTPEMLFALIAADRQNDGVIAARGYYERGVVSVAAPVRDGTDRAVAAINITAPADKFDDATLAGDIRSQVVATAGEISRALGNDPASRRAHPSHAVAATPAGPCRQDQRTPEPSVGGKR